ncbi:hormone receptor 4-like [Anopheles moucheti]|uniref:hormone receptor 4-like n=1 Tax=Anopheles moucheti TaxID=186751 RepID=UPI0022F06AA9|nr:hormone receptor 4-like [Anopheles moucheti]
MMLAAAATAASAATSNSISNEPSYSISKNGTTPINHTNGHVAEVGSLNANATLSVATSSPPASTSSSCSLVSSANQQIVSPSPGIIYDELQLVPPNQDALLPPPGKSSSNLVVSGAVTAAGSLRSIPTTANTTLEPVNPLVVAVSMGSKTSTSAAAGMIPPVSVQQTTKQQQQQMRHVKLNVSQPPLIGAATTGKIAPVIDAGACSRKATSGAGTGATSANRTILAAGGKIDSGTQNDTTQQRIASSVHNIAPAEVSTHMQTSNVVVGPVIVNGASSTMVVNVASNNKNIAVPGGEESGTNVVYYPPAPQPRPSKQPTDLPRHPPQESQQSQRAVKQLAEQCAEKSNTERLKQQQQAAHQQQSAAVAAAATVAMLTQQQQQQHYQQTPTVAVTSQALSQLSTAPATMPTAGLGANHTHAHHHTHAHLFSHAQQQQQQQQQQQHSVVPLPVGNGYGLTTGPMQQHRQQQFLQQRQQQQPGPPHTTGAAQLPLPIPAPTGTGTMQGSMLPALHHPAQSGQQQQPQPLSAAPTTVATVAVNAPAAATHPQQQSINLNVNHHVISTPIVVDFSNMTVNCVQLQEAQHPNPIAAAAAAMAAGYGAAAAAAASVPAAISARPGAK